MSERVLDGIVVTELGGREGVAVCGNLLAQLGAEVIVVEPVGPARPRDAARAVFLAGKRSVRFDAAQATDRALVARLVERSDVVIASSDIDPPALRVAAAEPANIVCDITAFGSIGPRAGEPLGEHEVQAVSGLMHTTGFADGPPVPIGVPITGYIAAAYATAGILAALRVRRRDGIGQRVEVAMHDAGFVALSNFVTGLLDNRPANRMRSGNRHPSVAPWSNFRTADGAVQIAAGSRAHWKRLCELMGRIDLLAKYDTQKAMIADIDAVEGAIEAWTMTLATDDCVRKLVVAGVAAGPITSIDRHPREPNLDHRGMIRTTRDPVAGAEIFLPASPLALRGSPPVAPLAIPAPGADRAAVERIVDSLTVPANATDTDPTGRPHVTPPARPLAGVRVIEIAQYTSAPLCARHLAHFGAEVIKIEKPGGDESRTYEPKIGNRSEVYCMNNAEKKSIVLDLQKPEAIGILHALLRSADVLIENNKPGTLAKFGLSPEALAAINPRLVYCAISGFGAESLYGERPGFDTVIQGMSGFMTAVNPGGPPLKSGISSADLMGALSSLVSIIAGLAYRDRTGRGQAIDISMQDVGCWLTATTWNTDLASIPRPAVVRCADGFVVVEATESVLDATLRGGTVTRGSLAAQSRAAATARLRALGLAASEVATVEEASASAQSQARRLLYAMPAEGRDWPMLALPIRMSRTPPEIRRQAPALDADRESILAQIG